ncbi:MAG: hypothetical protein HY901_32670 [Deltaproteobacteria bacterium]|nr:hypothetical protein [Deltaproteobacteria bacterium]
MDTLLALECWLGSAVGDAFTTALRVGEPAGHSPEWMQVLEQHGVQATPDDERRRILTATPLTHGAPVGELSAVLERIAERAQIALNAIEYPDDAAQAARWERMRMRIGDLRERTTAAYRKRVMPRRSMFAVAMESARAGAAAAPHGRQAFVLRCPRCRAPRLSDSDLTCVYCGADLGSGEMP